MPNIPTKEVFLGFQETFECACEFTTTYFNKGEATLKVKRHAKKCPKAKDLFPIARNISNVWNHILRIVTVLILNHFD